MRRLLNIVILFLAICWSLLAWGVYALVNVMGDGIAQNVDWVSTSPEAVEWLFWGTGLLTNLGLIGIVIIWLVGLAALGVAVLFGRRVKLPLQTHT